MVKVSYTTEHRVDWTVVNIMTAPCRVHAQQLHVPTQRCIARRARRLQ